MKLLKDLTREELEKIVYYAQAFLFLDTNNEDTDEDGIPAGAAYWNPQKDVSGADFVEHMNNVLITTGLTPEKVEIAE